jgi:mycothiol S-conjugate amidase
MPPLDLAGNPLCLVSVHAHPDDEASKGAGTVARYAAEGIRAALVCCTGGEEGEILNPAADTPEVRADLQAVREAELRASADAIGYARVYLLGYCDSGMPDTRRTRAPTIRQRPARRGGRAPGQVIRRERPQVLVTYGDESVLYRHPDHLRCTRSPAPRSTRPATPTATRRPVSRGSR